MSEETKHTPEPFYAVGNTIYKDTGDRCFAFVSLADGDEDNVGNIDFLVSALNSYDAMLAALKAFPTVTFDMKKSAKYNAKATIAIAVWVNEYCAPAIAKAEGRAE